MVVLSTLSVKVIDFGLAKQLDNASLISRMYTPMYFSPEQTVMGADVGENFSQLKMDKYREILNFTQLLYCHGCRCL